MRRRRRWAHAPVIHVASHFYREKRVAWVSISMHACDPVPKVMRLRLAALRAEELRYKVHTLSESDLVGIDQKRLRFSV